jgi:hypothetical protein
MDVVTVEDIQLIDLSGFHCLATAPALIATVGDYDLVEVHTAGDLIHPGKDGFLDGGLGLF